MTAMTDDFDAFYECNDFEDFDEFDSCNVLVTYADKEINERRYLLAFKYLCTIIGKTMKYTLCSICNTALNTNLSRK